MTDFSSTAPVAAGPPRAPTPPEPRPFPWLGVVVPVLVSAGLFAAFRSPFVLIGAAAGPLMATGVWWESRRHARRQNARWDAHHRRELQRWSEHRAQKIAQHVSSAHRERPSVLVWAADPLWSPAARGSTSVRCGVEWSAEHSSWLPWVEDIVDGVAIVGDGAAADAVFGSIVCGLLAECGEPVGGVAGLWDRHTVSWPGGIRVTRQVTEGIGVTVWCESHRVVAVRYRGRTDASRTVRPDLCSQSIYQDVAQRCIPQAQAIQPWSDRPRQRAGVGYDDDGEIRVNLDYGDPHVLVTGRTGSGKSEVLVAVAAALADETPPDRLSLLVFDFKGGATARRLDGLPHIIGVGTDINPVQATELLARLQSEIPRREIVLDAEGVDSMGESVNPNTLVIIIDEFQAFLTLPGGAEVVTDISRRGRSLGLRLVLGTQNHSGVVRDALLSNITTRVVAPMATAFDEAFALGEPPPVRPRVGQAAVRAADARVRVASIRRVTREALCAIAQKWASTHNSGPPRWDEPLAVAESGTTERSRR